MQRIVVIGLTHFLFLQLATTVFGQTYALPTEDEINGRISSLTSPAIPDNELLLYHEIDRVDDDGQAAIRASSSFDFTPIIARTRTAQKNMLDAISAIRAIDCKNNNQFTTLFNQMNTSYSALATASQYLWAGIQVDLTKIYDTLSYYSRYANCQAFKSYLTTKPGEETLSIPFTQVIDALTDSVQKQTNYHTLVSKWLDALKQRRAVLADKLASRSIQQQIGDKLPLMIGIV
jgi:hypothetical protein